jgi:hypothetical protein
MICLYQEIIYTQSIVAQAPRTEVISRARTKIEFLEDLEDPSMRQRRVSAKS